MLIHSLRLSVPPRFSFGEGRVVVSTVISVDHSWVASPQYLLVRKLKVRAVVSIYYSFVSRRENY